MIKKIALLLSFVIVSLCGFSQAAIVSSGGNGTGSGGSFSYSLGQMAYTTVIGSNASLIQGVQIAYEIISVSNPEIKEIELTVNAHPNPTTDYLTLTINSEKFEKAEYIISDIQSKVCKKGTCYDEQTMIDMTELNAAEYLLTVIADSKDIKTFKIIKK
ncbi:MAG: T9SS type A sorting domain-containing protein [Bacteroidales bacterium]|nr:T9SS type A sorting domain-containing protein [Bacteroidales bacterium]